MVGKIKLILILGIIIVVIPILGIPRSIKDIVLFVIGGLLIILSFSLRKNVKILRLKLKRLEGQQGTLMQ